MSAVSCSGCFYFTVAAEEFEREVPGFKVLSSAYGSVRGETGLCIRHDFFCMPNHHCSNFQVKQLLQRIEAKNP